MHRTLDIGELVRPVKTFPLPVGRHHTQLCASQPITLQSYGIEIAKIQPLRYLPQKYLDEGQ